MLIIYKRNQDEEFHLYITQNWCYGDRDWHPLVSTGPGLYYYTYFMIEIVKTISLLFGIQNTNIFCSLLMYRLFILPLSFFSIFIFKKILQKIIMDKNQVQILSIKIWLLPLLFFYQFLYYNEIPSTLFVCWMYLCALEKKYLKSALVSKIIIFSNNL